MLFMLDELTVNKKVVGQKQVIRALNDNIAAKVYVAKDADERITKAIIEKCESSKIAVEYFDTMHQLGKWAGIDIGAAAAAILKN
jgi:large subunit ribosomal protein L7A